MERFAGLNIHGFSPIKVFTEILLCCVGQKCSLFSVIKERCLYSQENFHGTLENREKRDSLASEFSTFMVCLEKDGGLLYLRNLNMLQELML